MLKHKWLWLTGLLVAILLAACGGTTVQGTPAPVDQSFSSEATGGNITFNYPSGWVANVTNGQIVIANSQAAVAAASPSSGQFLIRMLVGPVSVITGLDAQSTAHDVILYFKNSLATKGVTFGDPINLTIGNFGASRLQASSSDGDGSITAVNMGQGMYNIASVTSASGEMKQYEATLDAILATVSYQPVAPADSPDAAPAATSEASG
jgi:hypothetical protein